MDEHDKSVAAICTKVRQFHASKKPFRVYHGSTNSTRESKYRRDNIVDTSTLSNVLHIDRSTKTALVEPNVSMDKLVESTLRCGLIPPVVMEFPGITAGGVFSGTSGESSSYKKGFFDQTVNWIEMVLPNGDKRIASPRENSDLFYGAAESLGTLGVTTLLEIQLIEAKKYVELTCQPVHTIDEVLQQKEKATRDARVDYIDGIMFSRTSGVICIGSLVDKPSTPNTPIERFTRASDNWFYIHAEETSKMNPTKAYNELIPIRDYLFRYNRGAFWVGRYSLAYFLVPFTRFTRWLFNVILNTRAIYTMGHVTGGPTQAIIQDVSIPYSTSSEFYDYLHEYWGFYPIWLCPLKLKSREVRSPYSLVGKPGSDGEHIRMMLNFGVWGPGPSGSEVFVRWNRLFERKIRLLGGHKLLYARCYYTEAEFDEIYDREKYDGLRTKCHAEYLPSVYQKVRVDVEGDKRRAVEKSWWDILVWWFWTAWPLGGLYGIWCVIRGSDYFPNKNGKEEKKLAADVKRETEKKEV